MVVWCESVVSVLWCATQNENYCVLNFSADSAEPRLVPAAEKHRADAERLFARF
jgi:hypothetical protein